MDFFVMKKMQIKIYILFGKIWNEDVMTPMMRAKGIKVSEEFKIYSKFKNWYINNYGDPPYGVLELDKDCLSSLKNLSNKIYSAETCILIPSHINTFLSTLGKGIYITPSKTFCVRLRRKYQKENKNFKYLEILLDVENIQDYRRELLEKYVKIFKYSNNIC